jgi:hypothetical protein
VFFFPTFFLWECCYPQRSPPKKKTLRRPAGISIWISYVNATDADATTHRGLLAFQAAVTDANREDARADAASSHDHVREQKEGNFNPAAHSRFAKRRALVRAREARHGHDLDALVPILADASAPLRKAAEDGVKALREWFRGCNERRWRSFFGGKTTQAELDERQRVLCEVRDALGTMLREWRKEGGGRVRLIKPFERFFDKETGRLLEGVGKGLDDEEMFAVRCVGFVFAFERLAGWCCVGCKRGGMGWIVLGVGWRWGLGQWADNRAQIALHLFRFLRHPRRVRRAGPPRPHARRGPGSAPPHAQAVVAPGLR